MRKVLAAMLVFAVASMAAVPASADNHAAKSKAAYAKYIAGWLNDPIVIKAVMAQNTKHASLSDADIDVLDKKWRAEKKAGGGGMISGVLGNALSKFLSGKKDATGGIITEMFIMDNKGLNVGQSDVTSDYMQGDEAKWKKSYGAGVGALFIDKMKFDKSTKAFQAQVSGTIVDGGKAIGAITVGMNIEKLQ